MVVLYSIISHFALYMTLTCYIIYCVLNIRIDVPCVHIDILYIYIYIYVCRCVLYIHICTFIIIICTYTYIYIYIYLCVCVLPIHVCVNGRVSAMWSRIRVAVNVTVAATLSSFPR